MTSGSKPTSPNGKRESEVVMAKRSRQRGKVYQRKDKNGVEGGNWYVSYYVGGRRVRRAVGEKKGAATAELNRVLHELNTDEYCELEDIFFTDFAALWLKRYAKGSVKASTLISYTGILNNHLVPYFGSRRLETISTGNIQAYVSAKQEAGNITAKTINNTLIVLKRMLTHAVRWNYLTKNPADHVEKPRVAKCKMEFLEPHEVNAFLTKNEPRNQGAPDYARQYRYYALFATAIFTGARRGEILALQKSDINWASGHIHIRQGLYKGQFVEPKTESSVRSIEMSPMLTSILKHYLLLAPASERDLLFCSDDGKPIDGDNMVKREFADALRRAGLRRIRFHDLRHTLASFLLAQGEDIVNVQMTLGHASATTTLKRYSHLIRTRQSGIGSRLESFIFDTQKEGQFSTGHKMVTNGSEMELVR